jgi:hypothetical protein
MHGVGGQQKALLPDTGPQCSVERRPGRGRGHSQVTHLGGADGRVCAVVTDRHEVDEVVGETAHDPVHRPCGEVGVSGEGLAGKEAVQALVAAPLEHAVEYVRRVAHTKREITLGVTLRRSVTTSHAYYTRVMCGRRTWPVPNEPAQEDAVTDGVHLLSDDTLQERHVHVSAAQHTHNILVSHINLSNVKHIYCNKRTNEAESAY